MSPENTPTPEFGRLPQVFGLTEQEQLTCRVNKERFEEIVKDDKTLIHKVGTSTNAFGDFLFVTASRPANQGRICMTFYGLGYHESRERWITREWFWYQAGPYPELLRQRLEKTDAEEMIEQRLESIRPFCNQNTQTRRGNLFELLADLTDEDGALAEMEDLESLDTWQREVDIRTPPEEPPPVGEYLLDEETRLKLPALRSGEELGLDAKAQAKFFSPDSGWTWYASEFDGQDVFFGLVSGFEVELGYFSLSELESAKGPLGLGIERDRFFEPRTLKELTEAHRKQRQGETEISGVSEIQGLIKKLGQFGHKLSEWDKRIVEIVGIDKIANGTLTREDAIQLICTFSPEPMDETQGFFSIANLLVRNDYEHVTEDTGYHQFNRPRIQSRRKNILAKWGDKRNTRQQY